MYSVTGDVQSFAPLNQVGREVIGLRNFPLYSFFIERVGDTGFLE
jgi:hypothetical protein